MANLQQGFFRIFTVILWVASVPISLTAGDCAEMQGRSFMLGFAIGMPLCLGIGYGLYYLMRAAIRWIVGGFRD